MTDSERRGAYVADVDCVVENLTYDFARRIGCVHLCSGLPDDLQVFVKLFKRVDPRVLCVRIYQAGYPDVALEWNGSAWRERWYRSS